MIVVLDSSAVTTLALDLPEGADAVASALATDKCYMLPPAIAELYYTVANHAGRPQAEYWLNFVLDGRDVRVLDGLDREILVLAAEALLIDGHVHLGGAFSAALARQLGATLIATTRRFDLLASQGFCSVRFAR